MSNLQSNERIGDNPPLVSLHGSNQANQLSVEMELQTQDTRQNHIVQEGGSIISLQNREENQNDNGHGNKMGSGACRARMIIRLKIIVILKGGNDEL